jgi:large subunit ribosomal protein L15
MMKHIGNIQYAAGSHKKRKRIGRGTGSGHGGTSTRGHKGHQSRTGFRQVRGFEGGQMPLGRRLPKYGFKNPFRVEYQVVNVSRLQELSEAGKFQNGKVSSQVLFELGVINKRSVPLKILGNGTVTTALHVTADKFSEAAKTKIESAGGTVTAHE